MVSASVRVKRSTVCSCSVCGRPRRSSQKLSLNPVLSIDERVAFPPADRVAVVARLQVVRMRAAVHVDRAERVRAADVEDVEPLELRHLDELDAVRRQELARDARRLAARVRLELVRLARVVDAPSPTAGTAPGVVGRDRVRDAEHRRPDALLRRRCAAEQHVARRRRAAQGPAPAASDRARAAARARGPRAASVAATVTSAQSVANADRVIAASLRRPLRTVAPAPARRGSRSRVERLRRAGRPWMRASPCARSCASCRCAPGSRRRVISSPIFSVSRRQPLRCRPCGGPISAPQLATSPASSLTLT